MSVIKTIGLVPSRLVQLLEEAGYSIQAYPHPKDVEAVHIEGDTPVVLADVGRYTAVALEKGVRRDIQATQRFIRIEMSESRSDEDSAFYQLKLLSDFSTVVSRSLARAEIIDAAIRFLQYVLGADMAAISEVKPDSSLELSVAVGLEPDQQVALTSYLDALARHHRDALLQGIQGEGEPFVGPEAIDLSAVVPIGLEGDLLGVLSVRLSPEYTISMDTLRAMGRLLGMALTNSDLRQESQRALESLRQAQQSMSQSEKLAAVGMLAAGIAHEINNPASFIITNLTVLAEYLDDLLAYSQALESYAARAQEAAAEDLAALRDRLDVDYLRRDTPELIAKCLEGMRRIRDIVRDLGSFAHKGTAQDEWVDINQLIAQVLKLAGAELRHRANIELDLRPLPQVRLESTKLLQVLLNLIINAYQAFGDRAKSDNMVWVGSNLEIDRIRLYVADNGCGIPDAIKARLFEPFFTTKPIGTGTGLGLAISYELVRNMHGRILVDSTEGRGSRFTVDLLLQSQPNEPGLPWRWVEGSGS